MGDATKNIGIYLTLPEQWIKQIDAAIKNDPITNRQDFIRKTLKEKLEVC